MKYCSFKGFNLQTINYIYMFVNKGLPTEIKDAPTVPAFTSGLNKFYAFN